MEVQVRCTTNNAGGTVVHLVNRDDICAWVNQDVSREVNERAKHEKRELHEEADRQEVRARTGAVPHEVTFPLDMIQIRPPLGPDVEEVILAAIFPTRRPEDASLTVLP